MDFDEFKRIFKKINLELPLYKHLPQEHAESLINAGKIQIGHLVDYQNAYEGKDITDQNEGIKRSVVINDSDRTIKINQLNPDHVEFDETYEANGKKRGGMYMLPGSFIIFHNDINNFVYCMSNSCERNIFSYDACIEITDPENFFYDLTNAIRPMYPDYPFEFQISSCQYSESPTKNLVTDIDKRHPFIKIKKYAWQREVRAVWTAIDNDTRNVVKNFEYKILNLEEPKITSSVRRIF